MSGDKEMVSKQIIPYLSPSLKTIIMQLDECVFTSLEEIQIGRAHV